MSISDGHENDRPREKLIKFGSDQLSDGELLAILLRVGVKGKSAVELAQDLLDHFGSLHRLLKADQTHFCQAKGLGQAKFVQFQTVLEIAKRHFESGLKTCDAFTSPELVDRFIEAELGHHHREKFALLLLNQQHQLIRFEVLFEGTLNQSQVHIREVVKSVLDHHAAAVILTHNHSSGDPTPSQADIEITLRIKHALELIEVRVLDHIIIGDAGRWHSSAQQQQMP